MRHRSPAPRRHRAAWPILFLWMLPGLLAAGCRLAGTAVPPGVAVPARSAPAASGEGPAQTGADAGPLAPPGAATSAPLRLLHSPAAASIAAALAAEWQARWPGLAVTPLPAPDPLADLVAGSGEMALVPGDRKAPPAEGAVVVAWTYPLLVGDYLAPESLTGVATPPADPPALPTGGRAPSPAGTGPGGPAATGSASRGAAAPEAAPSGAPAPVSFRNLDWGRVLLPVGGVLPTPENIASGRYPGSRPLWLVPGPRARTWSGPATADDLLAWTAAEDRVLARSGLADPGGRPTRPVTLAAVGDVMLARGVGRRILAEGPTYPVALVADRLAAADLLLGNLESPIGVRGQPIPGKGIWFRADPRAVETLTRAGFDLVTVANNHILDYGLENFAETLAHLEAAGIAPVGGGPNLTAARQPVIREVAGLRVAFLGYSQFANLYWSAEQPFRFAATANRAGVAPLDETLLEEDIPRARAMADVVVVTVHWGEEYQNHPTPEQVRLARRMVDLGADLVLGHHPHAVQGFEIYRGGFIAYSLGNFIMDQEARGPITRESMLLEFTWYPGGGRTVRVTPVSITGYRPTFLEGPEAAAALRRLQGLSAAIR